MSKITIVICATIAVLSVNAYSETIRIGLNYPETGPYEVQGEAQKRAADMAMEEINKAGGILGRQIEVIAKDSKSREDLAKKNVAELIDTHNCQMIFGGSSSAVAIAGGKVAKAKKKLYFGTLTYSNETTGEAGHKYMFRECYNAWMGARVLADYIVRKRKDLYGKKYFYITADYTWGWTTEQSIRKLTNSSMKRRHEGVLTPFPGATDEDFQAALKKAENANPDVLVLVLFGKDMARALTFAHDMGLKKKMKAIVVPNLTLGMAESAGPKVMEGVIGALPWCWKIPYLYGYDNGKTFVEKFAKKYGTYPSTSAASAYTILYQYKSAVERAGTFDTEKVVAALEGHRFDSLKDSQVWRDFDHQCIQSVYAVMCKPEKEVKNDKFGQDYFEIINVMTGDESARDRYHWEQLRKKAKKPLELEW